MAGDTPRYSQPRHLVRWKHTDKLERGLIGLVILCLNRSIPLPWDEAASAVDPVASGEALKQATMKRRDEFVREGYIFPAHAKSRKERDSYAKLAMNGEQPVVDNPPVTPYRSRMKRAVASTREDEEESNIQHSPMALRKRVRDNLEAMDDNEEFKKFKTDPSESDENSPLANRIKKEEDDDDFVPADEKDSDPDFAPGENSVTKKRRKNSLKKLSLKINATKVQKRAVKAPKTPRKTKQAVSKVKAKANKSPYTPAVQDSSSTVLGSVVMDDSNKEWLNKVPTHVQASLAQQHGIGVLAKNEAPNGLPLSTPIVHPSIDAESTTPPSANVGHMSRDYPMSDTPVPTHQAMLFQAPGMLRGFPGYMGSNMMHNHSVDMNSYRIPSTAQQFGTRYGPSMFNFGSPQQTYAGGYSFSSSNMNHGLHNAQNSMPTLNSPYQHSRLPVGNFGNSAPSTTNAPDINMEGVNPNEEPLDEAVKKPGEAGGDWRSFIRGTSMDWP